MRDHVADYDRSDRYLARISVTHDSIRHLMCDFELDVGDRPHVEAGPDGKTGVLIAFVTRSQALDLETAGFQVVLATNVSQEGRDRLAEVGQGDRYHGGRTAPQGFGIARTTDTDRPDK